MTLLWTFCKRRRRVQTKEREKERERIYTHTIIEVGPGRLLENGQIKPIDVKVGDVVLLPEYGGSKVTLAGDNEVYIYRDDDIMGTLHDPSK